MQVQTVAQMLFAGLMEYRINRAQRVFAWESDIDEHRIKKDYSGTRRTIFSGPGQYRKDRGIRGKAAKKAARKLTHVKGYYWVCKATSRLNKLKTGETNGINN